VWNDGLARRKAAWKADRVRIGGTDLQKMCITAAKRTAEREWLGQVSAVPLQQSLRDLDVAYQNFFASVSGKRKGPKVSLPVFKSRRDHRQSARFTTAAFRLRPGGPHGSGGPVALRTCCIWRGSVRSRCGGRESSPPRRPA
jgi:putative transposase